jgi:NAD(P)-dependent dehydrogenase (short-subunit alcohol dehydrogenase family)
MIQLEGRVVLLTGAGGAIGAASARTLAAAGATVLAHDVRREALDRVVGEIGPRATAFVADLSDPKEADRLWREAWASNERIDVLVNNAGIAEEVPFLEIEDAGWDRVIATNLRGAFLMAQRVARKQVEAGGGSIIHIVSIDASGGDGPYASYNASKAGLLGLNRTMALELGPHGIRVNCVSPGFTHTDMTESAVPPELMDYLVNRFDRVPMRRLVKPEEIAAACAFLASDDASAITGTDLTVDCGLTANWYILETLSASGV